MVELTRRAASTRASPTCRQLPFADASLRRRRRRVDAVPRARPRPRAVRDRARPPSRRTARCGDERAPTISRSCSRSRGIERWELPFRRRTARRSSRGTSRASSGSDVDGTVTFRDTERDSLATSARSERRSRRRASTDVPAALDEPVCVARRLAERSSWRDVLLERADDPARRADRAEAERRGARSRRAGRADPRLRPRRGARLPDGRVVHGGLLQGPHGRGDARADRRDDPLGRDARPRRRARPQGRRQALDRAAWGTRRRSPSGRSSRPAACRSGRCRPRPRAHGRHARQARVDPGLPGRADDRRDRRAAARRRHGDRRPDGEPRPGRQEALRAARRDGDRRHRAR